MEERREPIKGYEGIYEITETGRVIPTNTQKPNARCGDQYGFHIVSLTKNGERENHNVFELWKIAFPKEECNKFRGSLKIKYGTACKLLKKNGIHFD